MWAGRETDGPCSPWPSCDHRVQAQVLPCPATGVSGLHWLHSLMAWPLGGPMCWRADGLRRTPHMFITMLQGASCMREERLEGDPFPKVIPALLCRVPVIIKLIILLTLRRWDNSAIKRYFYTDSFYGFALSKGEPTCQIKYQFS